MENTDKKEESTIYSIVVPVYNEAENVKSLHEEIISAMEKIDKSYEIIMVDDGSDDNTLEKLMALAPIKIIQLRKNFGQTAALDAGIKAVKGEYIITLDGDGQNPPSDIPKLIEKINEGYDLVSGWRYDRKDSLSKKTVSRGADFLRGFLVKDDIHDSGCTLKIYKKECFDNLDLYGEMHRFIPALLRWQGFVVGEVKVSHRERVHGQTKYNYKRLLKGFIDMCSVWFWRKYACRPLHLFGGVGILIGFTGVALLLFLFAGRLLGYFTLSNRIWPIIAVFMILAGLQLFISGILADILTKTYYKEGHKSYLIKKVVIK